MRLHLGGYFSFYVAGQPWVDIDLRKPARLNDLLTDLHIPLAEVYLAVVNGEKVEPEATLVSDGDVVKLFPPLDGG